MPLAYITMPDAKFGLHFPEMQLSRLRGLCTVRGPVPSLSLAPADGASDVEILITGWGTQPLGADILDSMPALRLVAHMAGTVKPFLSRHVLDRGVEVVHAAAANALPVAEYTLAIVLLANKGFLHWQQVYKQQRESFNKWGDPRSLNVGNRGKTVGIVGASRVGRLLIDFLRLHELHVILADPYLDKGEADAMGVGLVELDELFERSDVVSLHQPLLPETKGSIGGRQLAAMRDGAILINTARGGIVDHEALMEELGTGRIGAVLDVTSPEPLAASSPLWDMPNVLITPHIAGSLGNEVERMTTMTLDEIERFVSGMPLQHAVTADQWQRIA